MKPFVFKLETLLAIRQRREDEANIVLAQARARLKAARDFLDELNGRRRAAVDEFKAQREKREVLVAQLQLWHKFLDFMDKEIKKQEDAVEQLAREVADALKAAEKAMKDRKSVEKLRERRFEQYKIQLQLAEQKILDEIAITRYRRQEGDEF
ncbi:MAG: flagellar export protein FliJ [Acidaminococcales bacterium]|nr:flagellar export protein FliJ [Acidaminococcales bacterium]